MAFVPALRDPASHEHHVLLSGLNRTVSVGPPRGEEHRVGAVPHGTHGTHGSRAGGGPAGGGARLRAPRGDGRQVGTAPQCPAFPRRCGVVRGAAAVPCPAGRAAPVRWCCTTTRCSRPSWCGRRRWERSSTRRCDPAELRRWAPPASCGTRHAVSAGGRRGARRLSEGAERHGPAAVLSPALLSAPEPCAALFSCPDGFACVVKADGNATCTSLCHRDYCRNHGVCAHPRGRGPLCRWVPPRSTPQRPARPPLSAPHPRAGAPRAATFGSWGCAASGE